MLVNNILVVCTGNICRSPLAEALLRRDLPDKRVASAGIGALQGHPVDGTAKILAEEEGLEVSSHCARQIDSTMIRAHELILVMEAGQAAWIARRFPHAQGRVFLLGHWADKAEVPDPYRRSTEVFRAAFKLIERFSEQWRMRLAQ